jgi:hypothetical protein
MQKIVSLWLALACLAHAAGLEFTQASQELNAPADVASVTADFEFTNKSDKPIQIIKSDSGCSCVAVEISNGKLRYEPGESGLIRAKFDMGNFSGSVDKVIALWLDKDPEDKPSTVLKLRVNIPVLIALEPRTLKWDLGGKADPQTIEIKIIEGQTIKIIDVKSSSTDFTCQLKTLEEGKHYQLVVTPGDVASPGIAVIRIETDCPLPKHKTQQAFAVVRKP